ncbi:MAG: histidine--tRNA ligase [Micavibrio sp.]|nr:histidine--tRNA ligase [Micavibrio sp.]
MSEKAKKQIYKPRPISGFPEWLPEVRAVEQNWLDKIRAKFESYGYCNIETASVEELEVIAAKGEDVDKEIYVLERLQAEMDNNGGDKKEARLALHFDQTVPFARYVAQNFNNLTFPFKRYQMQKVWRGERPQVGRMREFYQCDIDVINVDNLPLAFDAEVAAICYEALASLDIGRVQLRVSNRKILLGYLDECDLDYDLHQDVLRAIDKFEKIGKGEVRKILIDEIDMNDIEAEQIIRFAECKLSAKDFYSKISEYVGLETNSLLQDGVEELGKVLQQLAHLPEGAVVADLSIVRGLDYYTGTVYETQLLDVPEFTGSVCSGGRYDDLAGSYINKHLPGVGISIGFTRLFDVMRQHGKLPEGAKSPAHVLMYTEDKALSGDVAKTAQTLRARGINVEVYYTVKKWEKHFKYADNKKIPYIWYVSADGHKVKDLATGDQGEADPNTWEPAK